MDKVMGNKEDNSDFVNYIAAAIKNFSVWQLLLMLVMFELLRGLLFTLLIGLIWMVVGLFVSLIPFPFFFLLLTCTMLCAIMDGIAVIKAFWPGKKEE